MHTFSQQQFEHLFYRLLDLMLIKYLFKNYRRHFLSWLTADFVNFYDLFCAELLSETNGDMTMTFSGKVDYSLKLCTIKFLYGASEAIFGATLSMKICVQIWNQNVHMF